ncbi:unnamed protein product [Laminaria digitata]
MKSTGVPNKICAGGLHQLSSQYRGRQLIKFTSKHKPSKVTCTCLAVWHKKHETENNK